VVQSGHNFESRLNADGTRFRVQKIKIGERKIMMFDAVLTGSVSANRRTSRKLSGYAHGAFLVAALLASATPTTANAQVDVTMQANDIGRTGQNLNETTLTTANVNSTQFGLLFSLDVSGPVYAQPLYLSGFSINGATHNVLFVATLNGSVYAFDANSNTGANANPLWSISLLDTAHGAPAGATTYGTMGTISTPVIDRPGNTLYIVSADSEGGVPVYRLHALNLLNGAENFGGPMVITATVMGSASDGVGGVLSFTPSNEQQRAGLLLLNGVVYVAFASYQEKTDPIWHGWIIGYQAGSLTQTGVFCSTPNGEDGGAWMSGQGLAADQLDPINQPYGRMFIATGNGDFTAAPPYANGMDYGDSVVNLDLNGGMPTATDDFTPYDQSYLASVDHDQGSGGVLILPTQTAGNNPNLLVQAGKSGTLYLIDRDNLGGYNTTSDQTVQAIPNAVGNTGVWSSPAYWNGNVYYWGSHDYLKQFSLVNGLFSLAPPIESAEQSVFPGETPAISANGNTQGIVWTLDSDASPAILEAHNASNVATTLYSSATNPSRDTPPGTAARFTVPTIANGMVYIGTTGNVSAYGLLCSAKAATPTFAPVAGTYTGAQAITISDSTYGAVIYYTTNGVNPTTSSPVYSNPIPVSSAETLKALAVANGCSTSPVATAVYKIKLATPTFTPIAGTYTGTQSITINESTTSTATIYYTTNDTTPTTASPVYSTPVPVSVGETLKAFAVASGYVNSLVGTSVYKIKAATPTFTPAAGTYTSPQSITINDSTSGAVIYYSTNGSVPTTGSFVYSTPIAVGANETLKAIAVASGDVNSLVGTAVYKIK
jgi:hypothetical protein